MTATRGLAPLLLPDLDRDCLAAVYEHVDLPFALKLTCRALRLAGPATTHTRTPQIVGSLPLLQWAHAAGWEWDPDVGTAAAGEGRLDVLKWALAQGCRLFSGMCMAAACDGKHAEVGCWLVGNT